MNSGFCGKGLSSISRVADGNKSYHKISHLLRLLATHHSLAIQNVQFYLDSS
jgi:hypothetical protein